MRGTINVHIFRPYTNAADATSRPVVIRGAIVLVHPWFALGGGEHNTIGLDRRIAVGRGGGRWQQWWRAITFALESNPAWQGGPLWGILLNHLHKVGQIMDMVDCVCETNRCRMPRHRPARVIDSRAMVVRHFTHVVTNNSSSTAPRLVVVREWDEFTSVNQLERMVKRMRGEEGANGGGVVDVEILPGVGHFKSGSPGYNKLIAGTVLDWLDTIPA
jgi:hypothetical protein